MKQFIISVIISIPLLITGSVHADESDNCGVNYDEWTVSISKEAGTMLEKVATSTYTLKCFGEVIAYCKASFQVMDQFIALDRGELKIDPVSRYPIICTPVGVDIA